MIAESQQNFIENGYPHLCQRIDAECIMYHLVRQIEDKSSIIKNGFVSDYRKGTAFLSFAPNLELFEPERLLVTVVHPKKTFNLAGASKKEINEIFDYCKKINSCLVSALLSEGFDSYIGTSGGIQCHKKNPKELVIFNLDAVKKIRYPTNEEIAQLVQQFSYDSV